MLNGNYSNNQNISILDLGQCSIILKDLYNISEKDSLIYVKQENINLKASERNIQYEVYHPYNFIKLNLSFCEENTINIYVKNELSAEMNEIYESLKSLGYNMFDIMDPFYQDICTTYKSINNTDIILSDRINYIYNKIDSQCQPNCDFSSFLPNSTYLNCSCEIISEKKNEENKFSAKKVYESFYEVLKYSNFKILKCYKLLFKNTTFTKNYGSIIIILIFFIYLSCLITFIINKISPLSNELQKIKSKEVEKNEDLFLVTNKNLGKSFPKKINTEKLSIPPKKKIPKKKILKKDLRKKSIT